MVVGAITWLYLIAYGAWRLLLLTPLATQIWQLRLSEVFGSWSYLPLLPLLMLALITRSRSALLALLIPALLFGAEYGRQFLPNWQLAVLPAATPLRVLTWNTLFTSNPAGEFQALINELQPDLIVLEEVSYRMANKLMADDDYPYRAIHSPNTASSLAIASRYPILRSRTGLDVYACYCLEATIDFNGRIITVIAVHIFRPEINFRRIGRFPTVTNFTDKMQSPIFDQLLARIQAVDGPLIVLGDFNTSERQPNFRRLRTDLDDAFAGGGWGMGYTFPANLRARGVELEPFVRIDHIFTSPAWRTRAAWTSHLSSSDHGYVVADLLLTEEAQR